MKKRLLATLLLSSLLLTAGCSKEETSVADTQEASIYVERNDMAYGTDSEADHSDEEGDIDTQTTDEPTSSRNQTDEIGNGTMPSTTATSRTTPTGNPASKDDEPDDSVYNTTVDLDTEEAQASFGKIEIIHYNNVWEADASGTDDTIKKNDDSINRTGIGRYFTLGDNSYGFYRDNLLATNGATFTDDPFKVSIEETDENPYAFTFVGAGHYLKRASEQNSNFWLELERNGEVLTHTAISKISAAGGYSVAVKGIAVKLGDFDSIKSDGSAKYYPEVSLIFYITLPDGTEHQIAVGTPYKSLVDILGEGTKMTGKIVIDEETREEEEVTYYVYKTADYTLIVEKQEYPDIKPEKYQVEEFGVSEETVLIKTIFLIKNEAELPPEPDED